MPYFTSLNRLTRCGAALLLATSAVAGSAVLPQVPTAWSVESTVRASAAKTVVIGSTLNEDGTLTIAGSGWVSSAEGRGAVIAFKWDGGAVKNKVLPEHPLTGEPLTEDRFANVNFYAVADADGSFEVTVNLPSSETSDAVDADWATGSSHSLTALAGSLGEGDSAGSVTGSFTVTEAADSEDISTWTTIITNGAVVRVRPYTTGEGTTLRLVGEGWTRQGGEGGSTVSLKLEYLDEEGKVQQYQREDNAVSDYLRSVGRAADSTTWALLAPGVEPREEEGLFTIEQDGSFDIEVQAPEALQGAKAGDYLALFAQSGRNAENDVTRSARSEAIPVNGVAGSLPETEQSDTVCHTDATAPSMSVVTPTVEAGGRLHLRGSGWCNTENTRATAIAVKIDEGAISHLDTALHSNKTIWAIIEPDPETGEVDTYLQLPDGTDATSSPALGQGAHSLRLLSGSLNAGDRTVTYGGVGVLDFTIGDYAPGALPDTVAASELTEESRRGVSVNRDGQEVTVRVPEARTGQWVSATPYLDGSVRSAYGSGWKQLDDRLELTYTLPAGVPAGDYRVVVQNGEQGQVGELLGWGSLILEGTITSGEEVGARVNSAPVTSQNRPATGSTNAGRAQVSTPVVRGGETVTTTVRRTVAQAPASSLATAVSAPAVQAKKTAPTTDPEAGEETAADSAPTASTEAQAASEETATGVAEATDSGRSGGLLSTNNLLLLGAAGILLALALTSGKRGTGRS